MDKIASLQSLEKGIPKDLKPQNSYRSAGVLPSYRMLSLETCDMAIAWPSSIFQIKAFAEALELGSQDFRLLSNCCGRRIQGVDRTLDVVVEERTRSFNVCVGDDISMTREGFQLGVSVAISCL